VVVEYEALSRDYKVKMQNLDEKFMSSLRDIQAALSPDLASLKSASSSTCQCSDLKREVAELRAERDVLREQNEKLSQWVKKLVDELERQRPLSKFPESPSLPSSSPPPASPVSKAPMLPGSLPLVASPPPASPSKRVSPTTASAKTRPSVQSIASPPNSPRPRPLSPTKRSGSSVRPRPPGVSMAEI
jgi:hypothetical protein